MKREKLERRKSLGERCGGKKCRDIELQLSI